MSSQRRPIHVLHVDDEQGLAEMASTFLERENGRFVVETASDAADGLKSLADGDIDCVVSDYDMPGRNGIEFLEAVRSAQPDMPFICSPEEEARRSPVMPSQLA